MNRRDFFKFTGKVAIVASLTPEVLADLATPTTEIPKTLEKYEFCGEYFDFGFQYGMAISIGEGENIKRHGVILDCEKPGKVSDEELATAHNALVKWAKEQGCAGLPRLEEVISQVRG